jgi:hypothetical protein
MTANQYQDIAKEFLDLWQKQVTSVIGNKQFIQSMLDLLQNMQAKPDAKPDPAAPHPSVTPASEPGLLAELAFRVAMCESRLATLEGKKPGAGRAAKSNQTRGKKPRK